MWIEYFVCLVLSSLNFHWISCDSICVWFTVFVCLGYYMVKILYLKWVGFDSSLPDELDGVNWMNHRRMLWSDRHDYYSQEGKEQRIILWVMSHHPSSQSLLILKLKSKTELEATRKCGTLSFICCTLSFGEKWTIMFNTHMWHVR